MCRKSADLNRTTLVTLGKIATDGETLNAFGEIKELLKQQCLKTKHGLCQVKKCWLQPKSVSFK